MIYTEFQLLIIRVLKSRNAFFFLLRKNTISYRGPGHIDWYLVYTRVVNWRPQTFIQDPESDTPCNSTHGERPLTTIRGSTYKYLDINPARDIWRMRKTNLGWMF